MEPKPLNRNLRDQRELRRVLLEAAYRAGLIANFTQIPGSAGIPLVWDVETFRGEHVQYESKDIQSFVSGLLHAPTVGLDSGRLDRVAGLLSGTIDPLSDDYTERETTGIVGTGQRVAFADLPALFGVSQDAVFKWARGGPRANLAPILEGVESGQRHPYANAWTTMREARHWGQANGVLNPDGTPNRARGELGRERAMKRWTDTTTEGGQ